MKTKIKPVKVWLPIIAGKTNGMFYMKKTYPTDLDFTLIPSADYKALRKELRAYKKLAKAHRIQGYLYEHK